MTTKIKTESRTLICLLNDQELIERGDELAKNYLKVAALDMEKKRITARIKPLDERIELLVQIIDKEEEEREVDCEWHYDFAANVKRLHRVDTFEIIDTRDIKDWERQQMLDLDSSTDGPDGPSICINSNCSAYDAERANGCLTLEHVYECDSCVSKDPCEGCADDCPGFANCNSILSVAPVKEDPTATEAGKVTPLEAGRAKRITKSGEKGGKK